MTNPEQELEEALRQAVADTERYRRASVSDLDRLILANQVLIMRYLLWIRAMRTA